MRLSELVTGQKINGLFNSSVVTVFAIDAIEENLIIVDYASCWDSEKTKEGKHDQHLHPDRKRRRLEEVSG